MEGPAQGGRVSTRLSHGGTGQAGGAGGRRPPAGTTQHRLRRENHRKHSRRAPAGPRVACGERLPCRAEADRGGRNWSPGRSGFSEQRAPAA